MKIGLVLDHFDPRRGGVEQWTHQLAAGLIQRGHEVHVIAAGFGPAGECPDIVPHTFAAYHSKPNRAQAAEDVLRALDLDVIHDMGMGWFCDVLQPHGGSRRASFEQNLLLTPSFLRPLKRLASRWLPRYRQFEQLTARQYRSDGPLVLALSEMVKRDLQRFHDVSPERIRLIYNGVDTERFSPVHRDQHRESVRSGLGIGDDCVLYLIVAHNLLLKGVPTLMTALSRLAADGEDVHLAVVGGKRTQRFARMASRLAIDSRVSFPGAVDDAVPWYAGADVYVQPTFYDPCSLVVLEALASGLPTITTRVNGAGELMTAGEHGFVLDDPADASALADRMRSLLDSNERQRMGQAARALALEHSFDANVESVLAVYEEVIAERQTGLIAA